MDEPNIAPVIGGVKTPLGKRKKVLLCLGVVFLVVLLSVVAFLRGGKKDVVAQPISQTTATTDASLPEENILVYTKCFGEKVPNHNCFLMLGTLFDLIPAEKLYPQTPPGTDITLNGVIDKSVFFTTQSGNALTLHLLDLPSRKVTAIYTSSFYSMSETKQALRYVDSLYFDNTNKKVFLSTDSGVYGQPDPAILEYDIASRTMRTLIQGSTLQDVGKADTFQILSSFDGKLFLAGQAEGGINPPFYYYTLSLSSRKRVPVSEELGEPVFDPAGKHMAYVKISGDNAELIVENTDGTNQKLIDSVALSSKAEITKYQFSPDGLSLYFTIRTSETEEKNYLSNLEVDTSIDPHEKGIILMPPNDPNIYKNLISFTPGSSDYQVVSMYYPGLPTGDYPEEVLLYQENKDMYRTVPDDRIWYLEVPGKTFPGNEEKIPVVINAKDLILIPSF